MSTPKKKPQRSSSDPLPFVQVDRAVRPRVALLAAEMKVTTQHALGSLVEFWDLCGAPRDLEAILERTPPGEDPAVVLTEEDLILRWRLASGQEVAALVLARLGLVEELEALPQPTPSATRGPVLRTFRVRGMSRYFEPILARLTARRAAQAGGRASAAARREALGTAQPMGRWPSSARSEGSSGSASDDLGATSDATQALSKPEPEPTPNGVGAVPNPRGQRSEVRGLSSSVYVGEAYLRPGAGLARDRLLGVKDPPPSPPPAGPGEALADASPAERHQALEAPDSARVEDWTAEELWAWCQVARRDSLGLLVEKRPDARALRRWWGEARAVATPSQLREAFKAFARDSYWGKPERAPAAPWGGFQSQWARFLPAAPPPSAPAAPARVCEVCGEPAALERLGGEVWGVALCSSCSSAWSAEVPPRERPEGFDWKAATAAWVESRRGESALMNAARAILAQPAGGGR